MFITIAVVIFILYLSYLFSKYMAVGAIKLNQSKHIKIIDKMVLGQDKMIVIVQIGKKFFLIGVASSNIQMITELSEEEIISYEKEETQISANFKEIFSKMKSKKKDD